MLRFLGFGLVVLCTACSGLTAESGGPPIGPGTTTTLTPPPPIVVEQPDAPLTGLTATVVGEDFDVPVDVAGSIGDPRLFVVEKAGVIRVIDADGRRLREPFLDLRGFVLSEGNEQGLVTLELHPQFGTTGRAFVAFTDLNGDSEIREYRVDPANPDRLDPDTERTIIKVAQPNQYHQSMSMVFGPDGYLWLSLGDGGGQIDRFQNGQDATTLLGTVVRLDVDTRDGYAIPPDNPFVDVDGAEASNRREIWAYGLRNPWRISIDAETEMVYVADVSQEGNEEINVVATTGGAYNFGWPVKEGTVCVDTELCAQPGFTDPIYEYPHDGTCAIVGGFVYRGAAIPELHGHYFFADHCAGWVRSIEYDGATVEEHEWLEDLGTIRFITSMSTDATGEIIMTTLEGQVLRIEPVRG